MHDRLGRRSPCGASRRKRGGILELKLPRGKLHSSETESKDEDDRRDHGNEFGRDAAGFGSAVNR